MQLRRGADLGGAATQGSLGPGEPLVPHHHPRVVDRLDLLHLGTDGAGARPIAAFFTALLGGTLAIAYLPSRALEPPPDEPPPEVHSETCGGDGCDEGHSVSYEQAPEALAALRAWWRRPKGAERPSLWRKVVRPALSYGFGELLDDLAFWLLLGVLLAGVLGAVLPADLAARGLGGRASCRCF